MQAPTILKQLEERLGRVIVRIVSLACTVVFILHVFACVFHYVALLDERNSTWVELSGIVNEDSKWDRCASVPMPWKVQLFRTRTASSEHRCHTTRHACLVSACWPLSCQVFKHILLLGVPDDVKCALCGSVAVASRTGFCLVLHALGSA